MYGVEASDTSVRLDAMLMPPSGAERVDAWLLKSWSDSCYSRRSRTQTHEVAPCEPRETIFTSPETPQVTQRLLCADAGEVVAAGAALAGGISHRRAQLVLDHLPRQNTSQQTPGTEMHLVSSSCSWLLSAMHECYVHSSEHNSVCGAMSLPNLISFLCRHSRDRWREGCCVRRAAHRPPRRRPCCGMLGTRLEMHSERMGRQLHAQTAAASAHVPHWWGPPVAVNCLIRRFRAGTRTWRHCSRMAPHRRMRPPAPAWRSARPRCSPARRASPTPS